jgi:hypothetical protein
MNIDQYGQDSFTNMWTGTTIDGQSDLVDNAFLGATTHVRASSVGGIYGFLQLPIIEYKFYAMSGVLTAVPEPSAFILLSVVAGLFTFNRSSRYSSNS